MIDPQPANLQHGRPQLPVQELASPMKSKILTLLTIPSSHFLCFILVSFVTYWNALPMDFIGDDIGRIYYNQHFFQKGFFATLTHVLPDRPFLMATMWLNFKLGGITPLGFKVVNVFLHGLTGFVLWMFIRSVFEIQHRTAAFLTALLFIVHPIHNQAVNSIIQRGAILSALAVLLSMLFFLFYLKSSSRHHFLLSLLFFVLGLLSKTNAVVVPFLLLAYLVISQNKGWAESLRMLTPFFPFLLIPGIFYFVLQAGNQHAALPWHEYLPAQSSIIFMYLKLFFVPSGLHFSYLGDPSIDVCASFMWLAIIGHCFIFLALYIAWLKKEPLLAFFGVAMYVCFLPESGVFPIADIAFEHRTYLPFIFLFMMMFWAMRKVPRATAGLLALVSVVTIACLLLNLFYNENINTYEKWVSYNIAKNPRDHNFNLYNLDELFLRNSIQVGSQLTRFLVHQYPGDDDYRIFQEIYAYSERNVYERTEVIDSVIRVLSDEAVEIRPMARLAGNRFVMRRLSQFNDPPDTSRAIDDLVYSQLETFLQSGHFFGQIYLNYLKHVERLKTHYESIGVAALDHSQTMRYLRVLGVLQLYYNDDIPELESMFRKALKQFPESTALRKTFGWFTSQVKNPFPLPDKDSALLRLR